MSKGELMELIYGEGYKNIDSAIPLGLWDKINTRIHVVNYNKGHGVLENLIKEAKRKNIVLPESVTIPEHIACLESDEYFYNNYCRDHQAGDEWYSQEVFREYIKKTEDMRKMLPS
jgi:hypothetical protein